MLFAICISPLVRRLFRSLAHFLNRAICFPFLLLSVKSSLCVLDTSSLSDVCFVNIFSPSAACLLILVSPLVFRHSGRGGGAMRMDTPCLQGVLCVCGETRLCVPHSLGSRLMCADASRQRERVWAGGTFIWGGNTAAPIALAARVHLSIHPALRCTWYVPCVILDIRKLKTSETEFLPQKTHRPVWGVDTKNRSFRFGVGRVVQTEVAVERGGDRREGESQGGGLIHSTVSRGPQGSAREQPPFC